ncbi:MAG TPA: metal-dependent hydrolase [Longimicrobiaceae bacterium]|nr:metal-dependent hydrolase [Longimicrobiaceae bacterium]
MFIGHFAVALAAKRAAPRVSLGVLFAACQLPDLVWPVLLLLGWERVHVAPGATAFTPLEFVHYPVTHSLLATLGWSLLAGGAYALWRRDRRGGAVVGLLVLSHWILDWVTHRPDLPLYPGGAEVGLGLWHSVAGTLAVEGALFTAGLAVYLATVRPRGVAGWAAFGGLVALLLGIYLGGVGAPPPPDVRTLAWLAMALWIIPPWAAWVDRGGAGRGGASASSPALRPEAAGAHGGGGAGGGAWRRRATRPPGPAPPRPGTGR